MIVICIRLLRIWWCKPLFRWAFRHVLEELKCGSKVSLGIVLNELNQSTDLRLTTALLQLLLLLPDEILERNQSLEDFFPKEKFPHLHIRDRLTQCRITLLFCFKPYCIDYDFLVKVPPAKKALGA